MNESDECCCVVEMDGCEWMREKVTSKRGVAVI